MAEITAHWLPHLRVLRLEPGDKLVLAYPGDLTPAEAADLGRQIEDRFPGHECTILTAGAKLGVVRVADSEGGDGGAE